ncbi:hypothetical protein J6590_103822 [Homalodisca vitripennis]|nr:hypothetical protein J6590_103822 [Homalodisca vitripennis]
MSVRERVTTVGSRMRATPNKKSLDSRLGLLGDKRRAGKLPNEATEITSFYNSVSGLQRGHRN